MQKKFISNKNNLYQKGITAIIRQFHWVANCDKPARPPSVSLSVSSPKPQRRFSFSESLEDRSEFSIMVSQPSMILHLNLIIFLQFGRENIGQALPLFISETIQRVVYAMLAHPQLSIRDHATRAFSAYLFRSEFQVFIHYFESILYRHSLHLPHCFSFNNSGGIECVQ
jgi:hypothetical protein